MLLAGFPVRSDQGRGSADGRKGVVLKALSLWSLRDENNLPSDLAGAPFSNITDRNGNVIPGAESHGIFPYARTSPFGINGGYSYVRPDIRFQPARGHEKP